MIGKFNFTKASTSWNKGKLYIMFEASQQSKYAVREIMKELRRCDNEYTATIEIKKNKRTIDQNSLMWALLTIYGDEQGEPAEDIYVRMLAKYGVAEFLMALPEAEDSLKKVFREVKRVDSRTVNDKEMIVFKCYYGSSTYDTKQMGVVIDGIFDELAQIGVDASTSRDVAGLYEDWKGR